MMKHILATIGAILSYFVGQWLIWSFVTWDLTWWNAIPTWDSPARALMLLFGTGVLGMYIAIVNMLVSEMK